MLFIKDSEFDRVVSLARNRMFAKIYYREKRVISIDVQQSYYGYEISGTVMVHGKYYNCYIETNRQSKITSWECGCYFNSEFTACAHVGAVILQVQELSPSSYPFHYESDLNEIFRRKREEERQRLAEIERQRLEQERRMREAVTKQLSGDIQQSIRNSFESTHVAKPMIHVVYNGNESFRFKIGESRTYFIKKLSTFVDNMNHNDVVRYGKPFVWRHDVNDLDEVSRNLYYNLIVRHYDNRYDYYSRDYQSIHAENDNIDDFYEMLSLYPERFENITLEAYDELVPIVIEEDDYDYIIESRVTFYDNYFGKTNCYYFEDNSLHYRKGDANGIFVKLLQAFFANNNKLYVQKNDFENFYRNVLEPVKSYFNIDSRVDFSFEDCEDQLEIYGDISEDNEAVIEVIGTYGDDKFNLLTNPEKPNSVNAGLVMNYIRDQLKDEDERYFYGDLNKKATIDFLTMGIPFLQKYADIYVTEALKGVGKKNKVNLNMGVSISGNLLELDIDSLDIPKEELAQVMSSFRKKKKYHRLKNGELLHIESDELQELADLLDLYHLSTKDLKDGHIELNQNRAYAVDLSANKAQHIKINRSDSFKNVIERLKYYRSKQYPIDERYDTILRDYQKDGYQWLSTLNELNFGGILADDMGLGKTLQMITFLEHQKDHFTLVICPASLILNWQDELEKFSSKMSHICVMGTVAEREAIIKEAKQYDVLITSYDYIRRDVNLYKNLTFDYVIIDEAQYIKNQATKNAQSVKKIKAKHHFALTGTPIENSLAELWSIFDFINKDYLYNYTYFKKTYELPIVKNKDIKKSNELKDMISPFILRRRKNEVLKELPDKMEQTVNIKFSSEQRKVYYAHLAEANRQLQTMDGHRDRIQILAMLTRLRQICCEPRLISDDFKEPSNKMKACMEIIESYQSNDKKLLVFSSFKSILELLAKELDREHISYYMLTGDTNKADRKEMVDSFQKDDVTVFLISLKAGGTGLNLTAAEGVIHFDPWWNMSAQLQATDRTHRIGQDKTVFEYKLIMKDSIEEKIQRLQEEKKNLADTFVENNEGQITTMTSEEILSLFEDNH